MSPKFGVLVRTLSIFLRFVTPVAVLALSNQEELGRYYLFLSAIGFILFALTFESGLYFARKHLRLGSTRKISEEFSRICMAQTVFLVLFFVPVLLLFLYSVNLYSFYLFLTALLYLYSEAISNEFGRFLTNLNRVYWVTLRDLIRSVIFLASALFSLAFFDSIVSWQYFLVFSILNLFLMLFEVYWQPENFCASYVSRRFNKKYLRRLFFSVIRGSVGVISQSWIMYVYPLLERLIIEKTLGLIVVGGYAFINSVFQAIVAILFLPDIAKLRADVIKKLNQNELIDFKLNGLSRLVFKISILGIAAIACLSLYNSLNFNLAIFDKFRVPVEYALVALIGVVANNVINIVSPHYSRNSFIVRSAAITGGIYLTTFFVYLVAHFFLNAHSIILLTILSLGFITQILARRNYL